MRTKASLSYKREQWPPDVGTSVVQISCQDERILQTSLKMMDYFVSRGIFELELLADGDALLPIDPQPTARLDLDADTGTIRYRC